MTPFVSPRPRIALPLHPGHSGRHWWLKPVGQVRVAHRRVAHCSSGVAVSRASLLPLLRPAKSFHSWRRCLSSTSPGLGKGAASGALVENRGPPSILPLSALVLWCQNTYMSEGRGVQGREKHGLVSVLLSPSFWQERAGRRGPWGWAPAGLSYLWLPLESLPCSCAPRAPAAKHSLGGTS